MSYGMQRGTPNQQFNFNYNFQVPMKNKDVYMNQKRKKSQQRQNHMMEIIPSQRMETSEFEDPLPVPCFFRK